MFFDRAFQLPYDKVYQSAPYRSESTGEWVIANAAKVNIGPGVSPAIVTFEITLESIRLAVYSDNPDQQVRVVDLLDGRVVIDSTHPQDVSAPLGRPGRPQPALGADRQGRRAAHPRPACGTWCATPAATATSPPPGPSSSRRPRDRVPGADRSSAGPLGVAGTGVLLLFLSMVGYIRHGRSMHRAARRDELTGLFNRRAARECAETMLARERGLAVILFDLDRFKHVNDSLGHHAGDHLLSVLGQRLAEVVREPDDVVARLGGDEFVVLARGMHDEETIAVLCERLTRAVSAPVTVDGIDVSVGVSIGIALAPEHGTDYGTLLQCADIAMYDAKGRRAGWQVYRDEFAGADRTGLVLDADLRRAVLDGELTVHYQPIFAVAGGEITGVEALVRWEHPQRGLLMPGQFVPFAETTGAIKAVTRGRPRPGPRPGASAGATSGVDVPVAVNVSAYDVNDPSFADRVAEMLADRGLAGVLPRGRAHRDRAAGRPGRCLGGALAAGPAWACGSRSTTSAPATPACSTCAGSRCRCSSWTAAWCRGCIVDPTDAALVRWTIEMAHALRRHLRGRGRRGRRRPSRRCRRWAATRRRATTCRCRCRPRTSRWTARPSVPALVRPARTSRATGSAASRAPSGRHRRTSRR